MANYYTYSVETRQLTPAATISKVGTGCTLLGPPPGAYPLGDPMPADPPQGKVSVPDGYALDSGRWRQTWRYEDAPPPMPRVFSKLKIVSALLEEGVWADVKAALEGAGLYDLFVAAQDFREDHPMFSRGVGVLQSFLEWTDAEVEELLAACVSEG